MPVLIALDLKLFIRGKWKLRRNQIKIGKASHSEGRRKGLTEKNIHTQNKRKERVPISVCSSDTIPDTSVLLYLIIRFK